jgi:putative ABC transport system permease protein
MSFLALIVHNVVSRKFRSVLTAVAVALGVSTVVTLGVVTHSLRDSAVGILQTGQADFTVAQKGVSDVLNSTLDSGELDLIRTTPGVASAVGALVTTSRLNAANPLFIEIGMTPDELAPFGVTVLAGRAFGPNAPGEVMLGYRAAENLGRRVGDRVTIDGNVYTVVGLFRTGNSIGDSASMFPLPILQANQRQPGNVTLAFVKVVPGASIDAVRAAIQHKSAALATVRTQAEFGQVDRNLQLISAADQGATILALAIGAIIVANTMMLTVFQRLREFGVLRAVGWSGGRIIGLVLAEALLVSLAGAVLGVGISFGATALLQLAPALAGILHPQWTPGIFWRALYVAGGTAFFGALYPAWRSASVPPLEALHHE